MKAFYVMFVMFVVLLLTPIASAQEGWPSCPWGAAYDPMANGYVPACFSWPTATESSASKAAELAARVRTEKLDLGWPGCPWGDAYDPTQHGRVADCFFKLTDNAAALKPAGRAKIAPAVISQQGLPCLPWGDVYDPATMMLRFGPECLSSPADNAASFKPAGLAKIAPVEAFVPCGFDGYDPMVHGYLPACFSQPFPAAKAASKPAGLAAPAPAVIAEQGWSGCPWGDAYDEMAQGYVPECFSRPADNAAALKPAGLAAPARVEEQDQSLDWTLRQVRNGKLAAPASAVIAEQGCPWGEAYDPMAHGYVPACFNRPADNAAALKPAGLAAPARAEEQDQSLDWTLRQVRNGKLAAAASAVIAEQGWPGCPWGDAYDEMAHEYIPACFSRPADNAASLKPAGLAKIAPVEAFVPCGFDGYDPMVHGYLPACFSQPFPAAKAASKPAGLAAPTQEISSSLCDAGESPNRCP